MKKLLLFTLLIPSLAFSQMAVTMGIVTISPYDQSAWTYFNAAGIAANQTYYGIPSATIMSAYNKLIDSLKSKHLFQRITEFYPFTGSTNADNFVNMVKPGTNNLVAVGAFNASFSKEGIVMDGTIILNTGIVLSSFVQDNMTTGVYYQNLVAGHDWGVYTGATNGFYIGIANTAQMHFRSASFVNLSTYPTPPSSPFLLLMTATGINQGAIYINGSLNVSVTETEDTQNSSYSGFPIYLGGYNNAGSALASSTSTYSAFFMMNGVSSTDATNLQTIISTWITNMSR